MTSHLLRFHSILDMHGLTPHDVIAAWEKREVRDSPHLVGRLESMDIETALLEFAQSERDDVLQVLKDAGVDKVGARMKVEKLLRELPGENPSAPKPSSSAPAPSSNLDSLKTQLQSVSTAEAYSALDRAAAAVADTVEDQQAVLAAVAKVGSLIEQPPTNAMANMSIDPASATTGEPPKLVFGGAR